MISQERKKILRNRIKELRNVRSAALEEIKEIQEQLKTRIDEGVDYGDYLKNYTE
jgi:ribosomal protein L7/L12